MDLRKLGIEDEENPHYAADDDGDEDEDVDDEEDADDDEDDLEDEDDDEEFEDDEEDDHPDRKALLGLRGGSVGLVLATLHRSGCIRFP